MHGRTQILSLIAIVPTALAWTSFFGGAGHVWAVERKTEVAASRVTAPLDCRLPSGTLLESPVHLGRDADGRWTLDTTALPRSLPADAAASCLAGVARTWETECRSSKKSPWKDWKRQMKVDCASIPAQVSQAFTQTLRREAESAGALRVEIPFACSGAEAAGPGATAALSFSLPYSNGEPRLSALDVSSLEARLKKLEQGAPRIDFYPCLLQVIQQLESAFAQHPLTRELVGSSPAQETNEAWNELAQRKSELMRPLETRIYRQGEIWNAQGAIAPVLPLDSYRGPPSELNASTTFGNLRPEVHLSKEFIEGVLPVRFASMNATERSDLRSRLLKLLATRVPSKSQCERNPEGCRRVLERSHQFLKRLEAIDPGVRAASVCGDPASCAITADSLAKSLIESAENVNEIAACAPQAVGESTDVVGTPRTPIARFRRIREQDANGAPVYRAQVFLRFVNLSDEKPVSTELENRLRARVSECYEAANRHLSIPGTGRLKLELGPPNAPGAQALTNVVRTQDTNCGRANSGTWCRSAIETCETIIHESLHLLGLFDEYSGNDGGLYRDRDGTVRRPLPSEAPNLPEFDCRPKPAEGSVMAGPSLSGREPGYLVAVCGFDSEQDLLSPAVQNWKPSENANCPSNASSGGMGYDMLEVDLRPKSRVYAAGRIQAVGQKLLDSKAPFITQGKELFYLRPLKPKPGARPSILEPAHLRAIFQTGCLATNRLYYTCLRGSYETSRASLGLGCPYDMPAECSKPEQWLK